MTKLATDGLSWLANSLAGTNLIYLELTISLKIISIPG